MFVFLERDFLVEIEIHSFGKMYYYYYYYFIYIFNDSNTEKWKTAAF